MFWTCYPCHLAVWFQSMRYDVSISSGACDEVHSSETTFFSTRHACSHVRFVRAFGSDQRGVFLNTISRSAYIQQLNHFLRFFAIVFCRFVPFICSSIKRCGQFFQRQNLRSDSKHCRRLRIFFSERSVCTSFKQKCSYLKHCYGDLRAGVSVHKSCVVKEMEKWSIRFPSFVFAGIFRLEVWLFFVAHTCGVYYIFRTHFMMRLMNCDSNFVMLAWSRISGRGVSAGSWVENSGIRPWGREACADGTESITSVRFNI